MSTWMPDAPGMKRCPDCAEAVLADANVCRYCGMDFRTGAATVRGTNGYAIASLVVGVVWFWGVGSILAVVFGHMALRQIRQRGQGGRGFAIAGLVLGYAGLVMAILGIAVFTSVVSGGSGELHRTCVVVGAGGSC